MPAFRPLNYHDVAKYIIEIGQYYVITVAEMNKKWFEALPADLQKIVRNDATGEGDWNGAVREDFIDEQRKVWTDKGGELISLPADEQAAFLKQTANIGDALSKGRPELHDAVNVVLEAAARAKAK